VILRRQYNGAKPNTEAAGPDGEEVNEFKPVLSGAGEGLGADSSTIGAVGERSEGEEAEL
jgi:hypothetical protein